MDRKSEIEAVRKLGESIGYGNIMDIASALWCLKLSDDGVFRTGHVVTVDTFLTEEGKTMSDISMRCRLDELKSFGY